MANLAADAYRLRLVRFTASFCPSLLSIASSAAQSNPPQPPAAAEQSTAQRLAEIQRDITQLKSELGLREEVLRLRKEVAERSKPAWVLAVPWATLGIVALGVLAVWLKLNWRGDADPKTLNGLAERLAKLDGQISDLSKRIGELDRSVAAVTTSVNELWKALAIGRLTRSGPPPNR